MLDRTIAPEHELITQVSFQRVQTEALSNNLEFFTLISGRQPVVKLELLYNYGGNFYETKRSQAFYTIKMLKEGTKSFSAKQISDLMATYGAHLEASPGFDHASVSFYFLDKHFQKLFPLIREIVEAPNFDEDELIFQKQQHIAQLQVQNKKNNIRASKALRSAIFGPAHPYGRVPNEGDIESIERTDLNSFKEKALGKLSLFVSGNPSERTLTALKQYFSGIEIEDKRMDSILLPGQETPQENDSESVQASIRLGKQTLLKTDPDYISLLIANHLLGGFFGSRLMKNIREDKGLTYGISSSLVPLKNATYWVIGAEVNVDSIELALKEIHNEIDLLRDFDNEEELQTAKTHMIGSFQADINSPFAVMEKFKNVYLFGLGYEYYDRLFDSLTSFGHKDLRLIAEKHLHNTDLKEFVIS